MTELRQAAASGAEDPDQELWLIASRMQAARIEAKFSQDQAAAIAGVSRATMIRWEGATGEPKARALRRLARAYKVSVSWLVGDSEFKGVPDQGSLLVYEEGVRLAEDVLAKGTPPKKWPSWLIRPPQLGVAMTIGLPYTVVPEEEKSAYLVHLEALAGALFRKARQQ